MNKLEYKKYLYFKMQKKLKEDARKLYELEIEIKQIENERKQILD